MIGSRGRALWACPGPLTLAGEPTPPVLVTIGEESEADFRDGAGNLAELPHVEIKTLPGQAHAALWMAPELVSASARRFLAAT
jgi:pimeloyl-ACP methyl ester carboxylesterase